MHQKVRYLVIPVAVVTGLLLAGYAVLLFLSIRPYLEVKEVRATSTPQTVTMTWIVNCGEAYYESRNKRKYWLHAPVNGKVPNDYPQIIWNGNSFVITGYPYKKKLTNIFTGTKTEEYSERFDVIEWRIISPYRVVNDNRESQSKEPVEWKSSDHSPSFAIPIDTPQKREC